MMWMMCWWMIGAFESFYDWAHLTIHSFPPRLNLAVEYKSFMCRREQTTDNVEATLDSSRKTFHEKPIRTRETRILLPKCPHVLPWPFAYWLSAACWCQPVGRHLQKYVVRNAVHTRRNGMSALLVELKGKFLRGKDKAPLMRILIPWTFLKAITFRAIHRYQLLCPEKCLLMSQWRENHFAAELYLWTKPITCWKRALKIAHIHRLLAKITASYVEWWQHGKMSRVLFITTVLQKSVCPISPEEG